MILKLFKGIKWKELKWWRVIYPEIGCKKNLENGWELNPCSHTKFTKLYFRQFRLLLIFVFVLISLVPLVSFGYIGISQGKQMIQEKAALFLMNLSNRNAESIKQFMIERVNDIILLSNILDMSDSKFKHHINQVKNDPHRPYIDFFILSESGKLIFNSRGEIIDPQILETASEPALSWKGVRIQKKIKF